MNILILSDGFSAPAYKPRLRLLCEYLAQKGHVVRVICEKADPITFAHEYPIHEVSLYKAGFADWTIKNIGTMLFNWKERAFEREVLHLIGDQAYDLVFCTSFHTFPLRTANRIARKRQIPCVLDLRDMVEQAPANQTLYLSHHKRWLKPFAKLYIRQNIRRRNKELQRADAITSVSPWHVDLIRSITPKPCSLVYNGYDSHVFVPQDIPTKTFDIVYTGKVFPAPQQDPILLFQALKQLSLSPKELSVSWYTDPASEQLIRALAQQEGVEAYMHYHGIIPQERIAPTLQQASICLVLTNRAGKESGHGKMTTKFFEALGVEKPVLCVTSDEECLAQVIKETNAGLSATTAEEVVAFILDKYAEWQKNGCTRQAVAREKKVLYSRQYQAELWEQIFLRLQK